jgi:hypothetical protein
VFLKKARCGRCDANVIRRAVSAEIAIDKTALLGDFGKIDRAELLEEGGATHRLGDSPRIMGSTPA